MGLFSSSSISSLTKKSTARDVLQYLSTNNQLAPYVNANGGGTVVVTGGNSGIGAVTVERLAEAGMKVVLCARNLESAQRVRDSLPAELKTLVTIQHLDLADLDSVRQAASDITKNICGSGNTEATIDCLVNNAGIMALPERGETPQGIELQFGTNHVGHHYLTRLLLPYMNRHGRIVTVSSTAHNMASSQTDWTCKDKYSAWGAYGRSKLANVLFAKSLTDLLQDEGKDDATQPQTNHDGITSVSLHPGVIKSPLWKHTGWLGSMFGSFFADKDIEQGAATNVYCALANKVDGGAWYSDCQPKESSTAGQDVKLRGDLWSYTEQLLEEKGYTLPKGLLTKPE